MKIRVRRVSAAALALVVCLSLSPVASAAVERDRLDELDLRAKIVRILKKAQKLLGGIASQEDSITPPRP
jgi:hypothetical protein